MRRWAAVTGHHDLSRPDPLGFSCLVVLATRYKTMYRWLHGGYMTLKTKKAFCSLFKQKAIIFTGGEGVNSGLSEVLRPLDTCCRIYPIEIEKKSAISLHQFACTLLKALLYVTSPLMAYQPISGGKLRGNKRK